MRKLLAGSCFTLLVFGLVCSVQGCTSQNPYGSLENSLPTINVQGEGKVISKPDEAVAQFGVVSDEKKIERAYNENTGKMNDVIQAVKNMGVESDDIKTSSYNVTPVYPIDENGRQIPGKPPVSFRVSQSLTVKIRDLTKVGQVIDKVIESGTNTFSGIQFSSSEIDGLNKQAEIEAAKDAKQQATLLADSLGVKIGRVLKVNVSSARPYYESDIRAYKVMAMSAAPEIEAGSLEIKATCNVVYEIEQ